MPRRREYTVSGTPSLKVAAARQLRAAVYTRVSTEEQATEGFSLAAQLERLRSYCAARDYKIAGEYVEEGASGRKIEGRPAYGKMLAEIENWDVLVVMKMDRIHRNSKNFIAMMEFLAVHKKEFVSMSEALDTSTAMGRFVMDILQRIAQLECEQIGERTLIEMKEKARTGDIELGQKVP